MSWESLNMKHSGELLSSTKGTVEIGESGFESSRI